MDKKLERMQLEANTRKGIASLAQMMRLDNIVAEERARIAKKSAEMSFNREWEQVGARFHKGR